MRTAILCVVAVLIAPSGGISAAVPPEASIPASTWWRIAAPAASCRPGDRVETGLQGEVTLEDRASGRSTQGYACNIDLVGQYQGKGANFISASYKNCTYVRATWPHTDGVAVVQPHPTPAVRN